MPISTFNYAALTPQGNPLARDLGDNVIKSLAQGIDLSYLPKEKSLALEKALYETQIKGAEAQLSGPQMFFKSLNPLSAIALAVSPELRNLFIQNYKNALEKTYGGGRSQGGQVSQPSQGNSAYSQNQESAQPEQSQDSGLFGLGIHPLDAMKNYVNRFHSQVSAAPSHESGQYVNPNDLVLKAVNADKQHHRKPLNANLPVGKFEKELKLDGKIHRKIGGSWYTYEE